MRPLVEQAATADRVHRLDLTKLAGVDQLLDPNERSRVASLVADGERHTFPLASVDLALRRRQLVRERLLGDDPPNRGVLSRRDNQIDLIGRLRGEHDELGSRGAQNRVE